MMTTSYWWKGRPNFGDELGPLLLEHFSDLEVEWAPVVTADLITVGSLLHQLPLDWSGIVAGSGSLFENKLVPLKSATVLGVRGPLTARGLELKGDYALGDPGLLANELVVAHKEHNLGLVPHWSDTELEHRPEFKKYKPLIIRPEGDPLEVLRQIGSCRKIVSSSLHGIIVADAFGIPRRTETTPRFIREGGDWKFRDHNAAVGVPFELGVTQEAPRWIVQDRQHEIYDMLVELGNTLRRTS
jgi:pyruvyltransferase